MKKVVSDSSKRNEILSVSFNQDCSCIGVGHEDGYMFYSFQNIDSLVQVQEGKPPNVPERVCIVEKFFRSSLVTLVSMKHTRKLWVYHSQHNNEICSNTFGSAILAVKMNRKRIVVCLEDLISIHNVRDMRQLHKITDTALNPNGIMDLSNDEEKSSYLSIPGSSSTGHVLIFDTDALVTTCSFSAHASPLAAMRFNSDGTKLATASEKGTVIRVFGIPNGERLFEFTRGVKRCVTISSLAFSADSKFLCLSSNTETVHVFALPQSQEQIKLDEMSAQEVIGSWISYFSQQISAYLPTHMNELMLREKSIAVARLPSAETKTSVAMTRIDNIDYLLVASTEGYLFCYTVDVESGECVLVRQHKIGPNSSDINENEHANPNINATTSFDSINSSSWKLKPKPTFENREKLNLENFVSGKLEHVKSVNKLTSPPVLSAPSKPFDVVITPLEQQSKSPSKNPFELNKEKHKISGGTITPTDLDDMDEWTIP